MTITTSDLIAELAQRSGHPSLALDEQGMLRLSYENSIDVDIEDDTENGVLHLYVRIMQIPAQDRERFYAELLEANLYCAETAGATLALNSVTNDVVLCRRLDLAVMNFAYFEQCLEQIVATCAEFREEWM